MFAGERQSGKHSRINYFPFDRYSTYFFYHVPKFVFRSKILNHFWTNRTRFQPEFNDSMLIGFFIVKWAAAQHYCKLIETTLSTGCSQNSVKPLYPLCTHWYIQYDFEWLDIYWLKNFRKTHFVLIFIPIYKQVQGVLTKIISTKTCLQSFHPLNTSLKPQHSNQSEPNEIFVEFWVQKWVIWDV